MHMEGKYNTHDGVAINPNFVITELELYTEAQGYVKRLSTRPQHIKIC